MIERPEWYAYRIGELPSNGSIEDDCTPFESIHHNAHVDDAFRIFADGRIQSTLVWDESKLKNTRTCVSWVSANTWGDGSIYGNVRFEFDWRKLIDGKRFYWVEAIRKYSPPAFRILISEDAHSHLDKYDVEDRGGPLFYHSESSTWYRNGEYTSEFMLDVNLPLDECTRVVFDDHHHSKCRRKGCAQFGRESRDAGAELFARLVGHGKREFLSLFHDKNSDSKCLNGSAAQAYAYLRRTMIVEDGSDGTIEHNHPAAKALVSASLDCYGFGRPKNAALLRNLFKTKKELRHAFVDRLKSAFDVNSEEALLGEEEI